MIGLSFGHVCDIERYSFTAEEYDAKRVYSDHLQKIRFRLQASTDRAYNNFEARWVMITVYKGLFPYGTDIMAGDRVTNVINEAGQAVAGDWQVVSVIPKSGRINRHVSAMLQKNG